MLKHLHEKLAHQGMRMICVLTKADLVHQDIKADVCSVRHSWPMYRLRELVHKQVGLPENQVGAPWPDHIPPDKSHERHVAVIMTANCVHCLHCMSLDRRTCSMHALRTTVAINFANVALRYVSTFELQILEISTTT